MIGVPGIRCRGLRLRLGEREVVSGLDLDVHPGEAVALLGPNGAGKTSTIRMICGDLVPDEGEVLLDGQPVAGRRGRAARRRLGYVPQELALFPTLRVDENLRFWTKVLGIPRRSRRDAVRDALEFVDLLAHARDQVAQCSGGMQRRLNLAAGIVHHPAVLVLDEPTEGVDPQSRAAILDRIGELRDGGTAVLLTTHHMDEVSRLCDRIVILDAGRVVTAGSPDELLTWHGGDVLEDVFLELTGRQLRE